MRVPIHASPDHDLLARYQAGDQDALAVLVDRPAPPVLAGCRRQVGSPDADDAVQAVFLVLAPKPRQAAAAPSTAAWLLRVARNVCANALGARSSRRRMEAAMSATPAHD